MQVLAENPELSFVDQEDDVCSRQVCACAPCRSAAPARKNEQVTNFRKIPIGQLAQEYNRALLLRS